MLHAALQKKDGIACFIIKLCIFMTILFTFKIISWRNFDSICKRQLSSICCVSSMQCSVKVYLYYLEMVINII